MFFMISNFNNGSICIKAIKLSFALIFSNLVILSGMEGDTDNNENINRIVTDICSSWMYGEDSNNSNIRKNTEKLKDALDSLQSQLAENFSASSMFDKVHNVICCNFRQLCESLAQRQSPNQIGWPEECMETHQSIISQVVQYVVEKKLRLNPWQFSELLVSLYRGESNSGNKFFPQLLGNILNTSSQEISLESEKVEAEQKLVQLQEFGKIFNTWGKIIKAVRQSKKGDEEGGAYFLYADFLRQEKEPNSAYITSFKKEETRYFEGMEQAYQYIYDLEHNSKDSFEIWQELRKKTMPWDKSDNSNDIYAVNSTFFAIPHPLPLSSRGFQHILKSLSESSVWKLLPTTANDSDTFIMVEQKPKPNTKNKETVENLLKDYASKAQEEEISLYEKVRLLAETIGEIERIHTFRDGNSRTSWIGLNVRLRDLGLPFCILDTPLILSYFSPEEIINELIKGMERFVKITQDLA